MRELSNTCHVYAREALGIAFGALSRGLELRAVESKVSKHMKGRC